MDVFDVRDQLIEDYHSCTTAFVDINDSRIKEYVADQLERGEQWPNPWLSLNPAFESGGTVSDLVQQGILDAECQRIFRVKTDLSDAGAHELTFHRHQRDAIEAARSGQSYVLTTGTGSGKSLAYIVPIVDRVLRSERRPGVKAIVVYPMNALANSQQLELEKFLRFGFELRAELDALMFRIYGISRDDADYILETFPIVKRKDIAGHGEYRTKRLIIEAYDRLSVDQPKYLSEAPIGAASAEERSL